MRVRSSGPGVICIYRPSDDGRIYIHTRPFMANDTTLDGKAAVAVIVHYIYADGKQRFYFAGRHRHIAHIPASLCKCAPKGPACVNAFNMQKQPPRVVREAAVWAGVCLDKVPMGWLMVWDLYGRFLYESSGVNCF